MYSDSSHGGMQYPVSRHWTNLRESAEFPTSGKEVVTLLGKSVDHFH
jgi:hypothetical protein